MIHSTENDTLRLYFRLMLTGQGCHLFTPQSSSIHWKMFHAWRYPLGLIDTRTIVRTLQITGSHSAPHLALKASSACVAATVMSSAAWLEVHHLRSQAHYKTITLSAVRSKPCHTSTVINTRLFDPNSSESPATYIHMYQRHRKSIQP